MDAQKRALFIVLTLFCLSVVGVVWIKMLERVSLDAHGAFIVLSVVCLFFLGMSAYMLFYTFGQKIILFQTIFEHSNDAISITDAQGNYLWQNRSHARLCDLDLETLKASPASFFINTKEVMLKEELDRIKEFSGIFKSPSKQGFKEVFISAFRVENDLGDPLCYVQMKREAREYLRIIEKSQKERERILSLAHKDPLTQLFNRTGFSEALQKRAQEGKVGCIIFADIDNFKSVNDTYGHDKGDSVLQGVSALVQHCVRESDLVARFGGEEFVLWVEAGLKESELIAEKIRHSIAHTQIASLELTCSFGVSAVAENRFEEAIKRADEAMYAAKRGGKNRVILHEETCNER